VVILGPYSYETFLLSFTILTKIFLLLVFYQLFNKRDILLAIKLAYYSFFLSILGIVLLADKTEPRISSFFHDPNSYGLYLTFILIMSFIFWTCWPKRRYLFIGFLSVILLVLTGSRGSLLTIGILTFIYVLYKVKEEGFQFIRSPLSILLFVLLSLSIVIGLTYRESMSKHGSSISNYGRFSQNYAGLKVIGDHAILGVGFLNSQDAIQKYPDKKFPVLPHLVIHNVYIAVFAELGIIGISLFLLFLFRFFHAQKKQPGPFSKLSKSFVLTYGIYAMLFPINFPAGIFWLPFMVILFISKLGSIQSRMSLLRPI
jgi:O-antigen ligase